MSVDRELELLARSPIPTAVFDGPTRRVRVANVAWHAVFGTTSDFETVAPAVIEAIDNALRSGESRRVYEVQLGEPARHFTVTLRPLADPEHENVVIVSCIDVTEEVAAFRTLTDALPLLLWHAQVDGASTGFNARWLDYAGLTLDEAIALGWDGVVHPDDRSSARDALSAALLQHGSAQREVRFRRADGAYRRHEVRFTVTLRDGKSARWFGSAMDLERHSLGRLEDQFVAAVSHELRAPVTTLLLWERVLRDASTDPDTRERALDAIHSSAVHQARLVDDLLDVSRAVSGKLHVELQPLALAPILEAALDDTNARVAAKHLNIERRIAADVGDVLADASRLRQIFDNVLANAIKFTPADGRLSVTAARKDRAVIVEVRDSGRGISADFLPRVFDAFAQGEDRLTRTESGLGLGLAIARELATLHHGTLDAASDGVDLGARFTLTLPVSDGPSAAISRPPPAQSLLREVDILVVDDDSRVLAALELLLARAGAKVSSARSASEAWIALVAAVPDVVICDIAMPGEDGYSFLRRLRRGTSPMRDVPAIALTAHAGSADRDRATAAGFDLHITKPVNFDVLIAGIARLTTPRVHRET